MDKLEIDQCFLNPIYLKTRNNDMFLVVDRVEKKTIIYYFDGLKFITLNEYKKKMFFSKKIRFCYLSGCNDQLNFNCKDYYDDHELIKHNNTLNYVIIGKILILNFNYTSIYKFDANYKLIKKKRYNFKMKYLIVIGNYFVSFHDFYTTVVCLDDINKVHKISGKFQGICGNDIITSLNVYNMTTKKYYYFKENNYELTIIGKNLIQKKIKNSPVKIYKL